MYPDLGLLILPLAVVFIWLGILSYLIIDQRSFLRSLFPRSGERDIRKKFEEILQIVKESNKNFEDFEKKLTNLQKHGGGFISHMDMMRYNPYEDTGGNMSFSLALLDKGRNGVVITSLHSRSNTRVFAKPVVLGKATDYSFSKEEQEVIDKAIK